MSTSDPITISFVWDRANFDKAFERSYAYHYKRSVRRYIGWFFIALAQFGVVAALKKGNVVLLLFATLLLLYWYGLKKALLKRGALRAYKASPLKEKRVVLEADDTGIAQGAKHIPWTAIEGVVPTEEGVMLYQHGSAYYLPESAFGGLEQMSRFKALARDKGVLYAV